MADATSTVKSLYPERMIEELAKSGLRPEDIRAKPMSPAEKTATGAPFGSDGYVIPYFDMEGKPLPFYRVKIYDAPEVKYRQLADSQNHIYCPPRLAGLIQHLESDHDFRYILITEGEKKAAAAVKHGIPCIALSGVDSWKSRTLLLPKDSTLATKTNGMISIKLPAGVPVGDGADVMAVGFQDFINMVIRKNITIIIAFDTDQKNGYKFEVQRAAAQLGFELRHKGIAHKHIRHIVLDAPIVDGKVQKVGLDDVIALGAKGIAQVNDKINECLAKKSAFPVHPNIKDFVNRRLTKAKMGRPEQMAIGMAILADLDSKGQRLRSPDEKSLYYFSHIDKSLTKVEFGFQPEHADSPFGRFLYKHYNLGFSDNKVMSWLASQYSGEEPIEDVYPEKVLTWRGDTLYYQIDAGTMAKVTKDGVKVVDNGSDNVLFESGIAEDLSVKDFKIALYAAQTTRGTPNWWYETLKEARIKDSDDDKHRRLLSLLYYVSPLFYRWRGTQLPVEITTGEAGSGKSTLYALRLSILTGSVKLRNSPNDIKDWNASIAKSGAMHITDNVQFTNNDLRQRLSDEICRLVTEAHPTIEQRKLYSDTDVVKIPVRVVFGITAIKQPFTNIDILQRAIITELDKGVDVELKYDADWEVAQLQKRGGRAMWLAHMLVFAQKLLATIDQQWHPRFKAGYRLINVEQLLILAATTMGWDASWIPGHLEVGRDSKMADADWALEGIIGFADHIRNKYPSQLEHMSFTGQQMVDWLSQQEQFNGCTILANARSLQRYMAANKHSVASLGNIVPDNIPGKVAYVVRPNKEVDNSPQLAFSGPGLEMNMKAIREEADPY